MLKLAFFVGATSCNEAHSKQIDENLLHQVLGARAPDTSLPALELPDLEDMDLTLPNEMDINPNFQEDNSQLGSQLEFTGDGSEARKNRRKRPEKIDNCDDAFKFADKLKKSIFNSGSGSGSDDDDDDCGCHSPDTSSSDDDEHKKKRSQKSAKKIYKKPKTIQEATAMTIAQMQAVDDGADPKRDRKLLPKIKDVEINNEDTMEIQIEDDNLFLSVDQDLKEVDAKIDQNGKLIIQLKEKYRCTGFEGTSHVELRASTGIKRDDCDFSDIICQNRYDVEKFDVRFSNNDCEDGCCHKDLSLERSKHLSFERGRLYVREGKKKYLTEVAWEIGKLLYVKKGITHVYPTAKNSHFDITKQPARESRAYPVPLFHDDGNANPCFDKHNKPTGYCPRGIIIIEQENYYAPAMVTCQLSNLKPNWYSAIVVKEQGSHWLAGAYHDPDLNGDEYQPFGKTYGLLTEAKGDSNGEAMVKS